MTRLYELVCDQSSWTWRSHVDEAGGFMKGRSLVKLLDRNALWRMSRSSAPAQGQQP